MDKITVKNKLLRAKDLRKVLANIEKQGYRIETEEWWNKPSNAIEHWTKIFLDNNQTVQFNWTIGGDEYDDKACHIYGISY